MAIGAELRAARERAGLSIDQIAERTKISVHKILALEQGDFPRLPQGIYLDGIVRAYAREVALDADAMVERVRTARGTLPGDWPVPFDTPVDLRGTHQQAENPAFGDIPALDSTGENDPLASFARESDSTAVRAVPTSYAPAHYDPPLALHGTPQMPRVVPAVARPAPRRAGILGPVLVLLAAVALGAYFYQTAPPRSSDATPVAAAPSPPRDVESKEVSTPFTENVLTPETTTPPRSETNTSAAHGDTSGTDVKPAAGATARPTATAAAKASIPNVSGAWTLETRVESSSLDRFKGLELGYQVELEQKGDRVTGVGRKVAENGDAIGSRAQTPMLVAGTIDGDRLTLNFTERGARRPTKGKFVLLLDETGTLRGRFTSTAARSSGTVEAHRIQ